ncbi:MAG: DUF4412 domain-containing protein [Desulfobacterales bacterium]|jgi:hypothetical protein
MSTYHFGRKIRWILCFVAVAVLSSGISAYAFWGGKITKFTADQVMIDAKGQVRHEGKIYMMPNKMRVEGASPDGKFSLVWIYRRDKNIIWYLNPEKKLYMKKPFNEKEMERTAKQFVDSKNEKVLGTEYINGYECTKKEAETTVNYMGYKRTSKTIAWISKKLDMPIRTQSQDGSIMELRNIKERSTSAKYFEAPNDYKQVSNMMELLGINMEEFKTKRSKMEEPTTEGSKTAGENNESGSHFPFKIPKGLKDIFK